MQVCFLCVNLVVIDTWIGWDIKLNIAKPRKSGRLQSS